MTKRENYASIREIVEKLGRTDLVEFVDHEVELLNKKNNAPKNPTAKQLENEKLKDVILAEMGDKPLTITEMQTKISALSELSNQRVSAIVKQLVEDNKRMKQYETNSNIVWNEFEVASAFYRYFGIIKKLYELQGWKVSTQCSVSDDFGSSPEDELIFEF
jgi:hypothetical protein